MLLHDVGKPPTFRPVSETGDRIRFDGHVGVGERMGEEICRRFRFSNEETEQIVALIANHMRFKDVEQMRSVDAEAICAVASFRGASGAAPAGLHVEPSASGCV